MITPHNPFLISGYHSPRYFCDRAVESKTIADALYNGRNITLISPRRMGKTGLIKHLFYNLQAEDKEVVTIYMDIYSTQNLSDLVNLMAHSILGKLDTTSQAIVARVTQFIRSCRPTFTMDETMGAPTVALEISPNCGEVTLKEIFDYLASSDKRCYIAIDEFQQIGAYPEKGIEALLRSYIQFLPNVHFIFSGSKQHVMQEMFLSAKRPFYQSTQILAIDCIDCGLYREFATALFAEKGFALEPTLFNSIYERFSGHTWYVQTILNRLYGYGQSVDEASVEMAINELVDESTYAYETLLSSFSANNIALLKAIAKEGVVNEITAGEFIAKHNLKAASSVKTSLDKLLDKELIYKSTEGYIVYDRFMSIWLSRQLF